MPRKVEVPEELKALLPEAQEAVVVVGDSAYTVVPLTAIQVEKASAIVAELVEAITGEVVKSYEAATADRSAENTSTFLTALRRATEKLFSSGRIPHLVAIMIDGDVETVKTSLTVKQAQHILGVLYAQNLDSVGLPDDSVKNFNGLLEGFGMNRRKDEILQWAEMVLTVLTDPSFGSDSERIATLVTMSRELGLLENAKSDEKPGEEKAEPESR